MIVFSEMSTASVSFKELFLEHKLLFIGLILFTLFMVDTYWISYKMPIEMEALAKSLPIGGSPFTLNLQSNRNYAITFEDYNLPPQSYTCGEIKIHNGVIQKSNINGKPVTLQFIHGINLNSYADILNKCHSLQIKANPDGSEVKGSIYINYLNSKISTITKPKTSNSVCWSVSKACK